MTESYEQRIVRMTDERDEFHTQVDGFCYWFPSTDGGLSASDLRVLADELDSRNLQWHTQEGA